MIDSISRLLRRNSRFSTFKPDADDGEVPTGLEEPEYDTNVADTARTHAAQILNAVAALAGADGEATFSRKAVRLAGLPHQIT